METTVIFRGNNAYPYNVLVGTTGEFGVNRVFFDTPVEGVKMLRITYENGDADAYDVTNDGLWLVDGNVTKHTGKATAYVEVTDETTKQMLWRSKEFRVIVEATGNNDDDIEQQYPSAITTALTEAHNYMTAAEAARDAADDSAADAERALAAAEEAANAALQAGEELRGAVQMATEAVERAETAVGDAETAVNQAQEAAALAGNATGTAVSAAERANSAAATAVAATSQAQQATENAQQATENAQRATENAQQAAVKATETAGSAQVAADVANAAAASATDATDKALAAAQRAEDAAGKNLPIASKTIHGVVKIGGNLSITEDGVLSANEQRTDLTDVENRLTTVEGNIAELQTVRVGFDASGRFCLITKEE